MVDKAEWVAGWVAVNSLRWQYARDKWIKFKGTDKLAKYVLLILVTLFAIQLVRGVRRIKNSRRDSEVTKENMIVCDYCHVHFPQSEKVVFQGRVFCSKDHQREFNG